MASDILYFPCGVQRLSNGNTLIADAGDESGFGSQVLEVSSEGSVVWSYTGELSFAHSAERLPDGATLISDTTGNRVLLVGKDKRVVWDSNEWGGGTGTLSDGSHLWYPNDAHMMSDGNVLVTDRNNNRCVLVTPEGKVMRKYGSGLHHPHNCDMLATGNVLVADSDGNRVMELGPDGTVVWSYGDNDAHAVLNWPRDADRQTDGNTLICDSRNSRLIEVSPQGLISWQHKFEHFANPYEADPLENGNVLVSDQQHHRVVEINRDGEEVWEFRQTESVLHPRDRLENGFFQNWSGSTPDGWILARRFSEGAGAVSPTLDPNGKPAAELSYDRNGALYLLQVVAVEPGCRYRLGASIATAEIDEGAFAALQLAFRDSRGGLTEDASTAPKGRLLVGTSPWTDDALEATAPADAVAVEVRVLITGPGRVSVTRIMMVSL